MVSFLLFSSKWINRQIIDSYPCLLDQNSSLILLYSVKKTEVQQNNTTWLSISHLDYWRVDFGSRRCIDWLPRKHNISGGVNIEACLEL